MSEQEKSVTWVIIMVMLLIAAFGWAFMAAGYAHSEEGWRGGIVEAGEPVRIRSGSMRALGALADFVSNAFFQIPNLGSVIAFNFKNLIWLPILIIVLELSAVFGGYKMKQLEKELQSGPRRRR